MLVWHHSIDIDLVVEPAERVSNIYDAQKKFGLSSSSAVEFGRDCLELVKLRMLLGTSEVLADLDDVEPEDLYEELLVHVGPLLSILVLSIPFQMSVQEYNRD